MFNRKSPEAKLASELEAARKNRARVASELDTGTAIVTSLQADNVRLAVAGNRSEAIAANSAKIVTAERTVATLSAALTQIDDQIDKVAAEHAAIVDVKQRTETGDELNGIDEQLSTDAAAFVLAAEKLANSAKRAVPAVQEAQGVVNFAEQSAALTTEAVAHVQRCLSDYRRGVLAGMYPARLAIPETPAAHIPAPQPETVEMLCAHHVCWSDPATGNVRLNARGHRVLLPRALLDNALRLRAVVPLGSEQAKVLVQSKHSTIVPGLDACISLDDASKTAKEQDVAQRARTPNATTNFKPLDRGPSYTLPVAAA